MRSVFRLGRSKRNLSSRETLLVASYGKAVSSVSQGSKRAPLSGRYGRYEACFLRKLLSVSGYRYMELGFL